MPRTAAEKRAIFCELHTSDCFVLPNPWDVGLDGTLIHGTSGAPVPDCT